MKLYFSISKKIMYLKWREKYDFKLDFLKNPSPKGEGIYKINDELFSASHEHDHYISS